MQVAQPAAPNASRTALPVAAIIAVSAGATAFLLWLLYVHHAPAEFAARLTFLPGLNALLNGLSAICLTVGFSFIRKRHIARHRSAMIAAFVFSSLFLISYITNHALHGDTHFATQGIVRPIYFFTLITHVFLSVIALPMVLVTFFFSLSGRFPQHRRIARFTFPVWLYVSVTGVLVYAMLKAWN